MAKLCFQPENQLKQLSINCEHFDWNFQRIRKHLHEQLNNLVSRFESVKVNENEV